MIQLTERQHALSCVEVWGSNRSVTRTVNLADLTAWIYSRPAEGEDGGDIHYLSVCGQSVLSRVVLADVSGHGPEVSDSAQFLHALMCEHINTWDQTEFVRHLNKSFRGCITRGKYATAVILGIIRGTGEITEAQDGFGDMLGRDRLLSWACMAPLDDPAAAGEFLLERLRLYRRNHFTDDETIIAIQREDRP
jgi:serine phosphatase RsbU (regulator of sigma subunit)